LFDAPVDKGREVKTPPLKARLPKIRQPLKARLPKIKQPLKARLPKIKG
jgi:hypothetical protein